MQFFFYVIYLKTQFSGKFDRRIMQNEKDQIYPTVEFIFFN